MLHGVVALGEADGEVALHRHRDRRPHRAGQRDLDHGQPVRGQPGPAMEKVLICVNQNVTEWDQLRIPDIFTIKFVVFRLRNFSNEKGIPFLPSKPSSAQQAIYRVHQ